MYIMLQSTVRLLIALIFESPNRGCIDYSTNKWIVVHLVQFPQVTVQFLIKNHTEQSLPFVKRCYNI